jgi:hypothetical protein
VEECSYALVFSRSGVTKLSLAAQKLAHWMQLAKQELTPTGEHAGDLCKNRFKILDMFENQHRHDNIG